MQQHALLPHLLDPTFKFCFWFILRSHGVKILKDYVSESTFYQQVLYLSTIVFIHHFIMFSFEAFSFDLTLLILYKSLINSILSLIFCVTLIYIMIENEK